MIIIIRFLQKIVICQGFLKIVYLLRLGLNELKILDLNFAALL